MTATNLHRLAKNFSIVLGSSSPRRKQILNDLTLNFEILTPHIFEVRKDHEEPYQYALRLAKDKAQAVLSLTNDDHQIVIGCDTIVVLDGEVLEKPVDKNDAFKMLKALSGKMHTVCSAVALASNKYHIESGYELTDVYFHSHSDAQLLDYIETGEPMDKAGAYGIQGKGAFLVDRIEGNLDNVIGLPLTLLQQLAGKILDT